MVDAKTNDSQKKIYVLDTSVLLSSPYAIFAFDEHVVWIPYNVITDLDAMRKTTNEASKNAQEALRIIEELRERGNLREGVPLKSGGIVCVGNSRSQSPIEAAQTLPSYCYNDDIDRFGIPNTIPVSEAKADSEYIENEFVTVKRANESTLGIYQVKGNNLVRLNFDAMHPYGVKPRNAGQKMAMHALLDSLESSALTILMGDAGTAKTFLSLACGLEQTVGEDPKYRSMLVVRPNVKFDETVGFLKGSEAQKINPLIRPIMDNLDQLTAVNSEDYGTKQGKGGKKSKFATEEAEDKIVAPNSYAQYLFDSGKIEAQAMEYMRGRSIRDRYMIIDEAQNMTPLQAFGIISRAGVGTKIILTGDPNQVDNPLLDSKTNGLTYAANAMKGSKVCTQITFEESECERSELAKEAIKRMKIKGKGRESR